VSQVVLYEQRDAVALITLNRPEVLNSFNQALRLECAGALRRAAADPTVSAVVLTAAGRAFSAGADLKAMDPRQIDGDEVRRQLEEEYGAGLSAIMDMDKPVIAAVEGLVAGIGCAYVLASDLVVMAEDAYFTLPFHNIGLIPDGGINWLLERQLGARRAFELAVDCERVPAARCRELGLVNRLTQKGAAAESALQWAGRLAGRAPLAIRHTKKLLRQAAGVDYLQSLRAEAAAQRHCVDSQDFREGVAAFLEKREPRFSGR
jgi:2-(1,2-epoxy-1,2-dihydrophenyl)acetyl-CoA isomerase